MSRPICHVVAGPNGSGKSTFALDYLPEFAGSIEYVNFRVFDASDIKQRLVYTRNGKSVGYGPHVAAMRKDLGL